MLTMAQIKYIKHLRDREDKSIAEISQTVGVDWRTAKKYADREDWNQVDPRRKKARPVMGPFEEIIDTWLWEDLRSPKKQRHTGRRVYDRLVAEHGFSGGYRTVRGYVAQRKRQIMAEEQARYAKLEHPGGEAQADFGTVNVVEQGKLKEVKYLALSFPFSNAGFTYVVPGENAECLLEALKRVFQRIGGVPQKIWFDNLPAAVTKVLTGGDRKLTEIFERFCLHYRFEPVFCNVGCGNEKGHVENKVGFTRRNWFVPVPQVEDLECFNKQLLQKAEDDMHRTHYEKGREIAELWAEERDKFLTLPKVPFEVVQLLTASVDKYSRIRFKDHAYEVPRANPGDRVLLKVFWDRIEILSQELKMLCTCARPYTTKETPIDWPAQLELFRKKPRALAYSSYLEYLPSAIKDFFLSRMGSERGQRVAMVIRLLKSGYTIEQIAEALAVADRDGMGKDAGSIYHLLYRQTHGQRSEEMAEHYTPACIAGYTPDISVYDRLTRKGAGPGGVKPA